MSDEHITDLERERARREGRETEMSDVERTAESVRSSMAPMVERGDRVALVRRQSLSEIARRFRNVSSGSLSV